MLRQRGAVRVLLLWLAIWTGFSVIRVFVRVIMLPAAHPPVMLMIARTLLAQAPWVVASPLIVFLGAQFLGRHRTAYLFVHLAAAATLAVLDAVWSYAALEATGISLPVTFSGWFLGRAEQSVLLYACLAAAGAAVRHWQRISAARQRDARQEAQLLQARLQALSAQLQPHFLFNALNSVSELVYREPVKAAAMLASLRRLLARVLADDARQEVPLTEELELVQAYVDIQQMRFADSLDIRIDVVPAVADILVPRLLLQPVVENAVRHGASRRSGPCHITIRARVQQGHLEIVVRDDGMGLPAGPLREGLGLGNCRARLYELHGDRAALHLKPRVGGGAETKILLPARWTSSVNERHDQAVIAGVGPDVAAKDQHLSWSWARFGLLLCLLWGMLATIGATSDVLSAGEGSILSWSSAFRSRLLEAGIWVLLSPPIVAMSVLLARVRWPRWRVYLALVPIGIGTAWLQMVIVGAVVTLSRSDRAALLLYNLAAFTIIAVAGHAWALHRLLLERQRAEIDLERAIAAERLRALRCRLPADFIDATLVRISKLAAHSPAAADQLTGTFGEQLRHLLQRDQPPAVIA